MSEMTLKQAQNEVAIEGIFQELDIHEGVTTGKDGKEKEYIRGTVTVLVEQTVGKELETEEVAVSFFSAKYKNAGGPNPSYENINKLRDFKRRSVDGDAADYIRLSSSGNINENMFVSRNSGQMINGWVINGSFFSKVVGTPNPKAVFKVKIVVRSIEEEMGSDGTLTGRLKIKGIIVQYGGRADVVDFVVEDAQAASHILKRFQEKDTIIVGGYVRTTMANVVRDRGASDGEFMIGEDMNFSTVSSVRKRELVITAVSPNPLDGDAAYDMDAIHDALNARKERMDRIMSEGAKQSATVAAKPKTNRGW